MKCILHLGLPKTATTSLQKNVFPHLPGVKLSVRETNGPAVALQNVRYVAADVAKLGQDESWYLTKLRQRFEMSSGDESQFHTMVVSNESVIGPHPDGHAAIIQRVKAICADARVLLVLREPMDFLKSMYRQELENYVSRICSGIQAPVPIRDFNSFVTQALAGGVKNHLAYLHHKEIVDSLYSNFGKPNVLILDYSLLMDSESKFLSEILGFVGVTCDRVIALGRENSSTGKLEKIQTAASKHGVSIDHQAEIALAYRNLELAPAVLERLTAYIAQHAL